MPLCEDYTAVCCLWYDLVHVLKNGTFLDSLHVIWLQLWCGHLNRTLTDLLFMFIFFLDVYNLVLDNCSVSDRGRWWIGQKYFFFFKFSLPPRNDRGMSRLHPVLIFHLSAQINYKMELSPFFVAIFHRQNEKSLPLNFWKRLFYAYFSCLHKRSYSNNAQMCVGW